MYIRRKVFSLTDEGFSPVEETTFDEQESLYSVVMTEDEVSLFSDVCEYLFSDEEEEQPKKGLSKRAKVGIGAGAGLAALATPYGVGKLVEHRGRKLADKAKELGKKALTDDEFKSKAIETNNKSIKKIQLGKNLQKPYNYVANGAKNFWAGQNGPAKWIKGEWAKNHGKLINRGAAGALAAAGLTAAGVAAYKHHKNKSNDE